jgi:hypothetical protein
MATAATTPPEGAHEQLLDPGDPYAPGYVPAAQTIDPCDKDDAPPVVVEYAWRHCVGAVLIAGAIVLMMAASYGAGLHAHDHAHDVACGPPDTCGSGSAS